MKTLSMLDIIKAAMEKHGADGLYNGTDPNGKCGCGIDDLAPCSGIQTGCVLAKSRLLQEGDGDEYNHHGDTVWAPLNVEPKEGTAEILGRKAKEMGNPELPVIPILKRMMQYSQNPKTIVIHPAALQVLVKHLFADALLFEKHCFAFGPDVFYGMNVVENRFLEEHQFAIVDKHHNILHVGSIFKEGKTEHAEEQPEERETT
jgi:hypothetical protein